MTSYSERFPARCCCGSHHQAENRVDLRAKLSVDAGGVVFTTIQKFLPEEKGDRHPVLSHRRNIVVIADEAHRSQYDFIDGFARHMRDALPNASFIGFTGTPIEVTDKNTRAVFGDYISVYDIQRAVVDKATVPIYYESRLATLALDAKERPNIDPEFEDVTEGEEVEKKEKLKSKWAQLEVVVGSEKRVKLVARDLVDHFEQRLETMEGKAMVVCMSRRICVELYKAITALQPRWHDNDDGKRACLTGRRDIFSKFMPKEWPCSNSSDIASYSSFCWRPRQRGLRTLWRWKTQLPRARAITCSKLRVITQGTMNSNQRC
jgi:type I restriction enzyme R subunit